MRPFLMFVALLLAPYRPRRRNRQSPRATLSSSAKAGLAEEVLLALIDVHRPVFPVDTSRSRAEGCRRGAQRDRCDDQERPRVSRCPIGRRRSPAGRGVNRPARGRLPRAGTPRTILRRASATKTRVREVAVPVYIAGSRPVEADRPPASTSRGTGLLGIRRKAASGRLENSGRRTEGRQDSARTSKKVASSFQLPTPIRQSSWKLEIGSWEFTSLRASSSRAAFSPPDPP